VFGSGLEPVHNWFSKKTSSFTQTGFEPNFREEKRFSKPKLKHIIKIVESKFISKIKYIKMIDSFSWRYKRNY